MLHALVRHLGVGAGGAQAMGIAPKSRAAAPRLRSKDVEVQIPLTRRLVKVRFGSSASTASNSTIFHAEHNFGTTSIPLAM